MDQQPVSLKNYISHVRADFAHRLGQDFEHKRRARDFKTLFLMAVNKRFKNLTLCWTTYHTKQTKDLFKAYSPDLIRQMIDRYLDNDKYRQTKGVSFSGFFAMKEKLAEDIAASTVTAAKVEERKAQTDPVVPQESDVEAFKKSAFYKKMPKIFQEKIDA